MAVQNDYHDSVRIIADTVSIDEETVWQVLFHRLIMTRINTESSPKRDTPEQKKSF